MTQGNTEVKNSYEIGGYKSVEELASEVEKKNKDLAEKIRTNAKKQILEEGKDWRISLKEELTPDDEKALREALPDTDVQSYFNDGMTSQEKILLEGQKKLEETIPGGKEVSKKIDWLKSIQDGWEAASELLEKNDYFGAFKVFFASLAGGFSLEAWHKKDQPKTFNDTMSETGKNSTYIIGIKFLLGLSDEDTSIGYDVLQQEKIKTLTYNKLDIDNLDESKKQGIAKKYGLDDSKDNDVYETLLTLKKKEKYIDKIIGKNKPNWKNELTLENLIGEFYKYIKPLERIKNLNVDDLLKGEFNILTLDFKNKEDGTLNEILENRLNDNNGKLKGVDKNFLENIFFNKSTQFDEKLLLGMNGGNNKEFIDDFISFRQKIPNLMAKNFFHGQIDDDGKTKNDFEKYLNNYNYSQGDILELYIITNGNLDFNSYGEIEKSLIFTKIFQLLGKGNDGLRGATYGYAIREALEGNTRLLNEIPEGFRIGLLNFIKEYGMKAIMKSVGIAKDLFYALNGTEKTYVIGAGIVGLVGLFTLGRIMTQIKGIGLGFLGGLGVASVTEIYNYCNGNPKTKEVLKKYNIDSKDDLLEQIESSTSTN